MTYWHCIGGGEAGDGDRGIIDDVVAWRRLAALMTVMMAGDGWR